MTLPRTYKYECHENPAEKCSRAEDKTVTYICNICEKEFSTKNNLIVHVNSHNLNDSELDEKQETPNTCSICLKKFTAKKNLLKHLRDVHKNYSEAERMVVKKLKCPEKNCGFLCRMTRDLRNHIEIYHKIKILKDTLQFQSEPVFQKWKKEEESNTVSWFVCGRKKTTLTDGTKRQTYYCHRTGHYIPRGFGKYRMRSVGSCKIGVTCPAAMEVTESEDGELTVIYYKTHLGHMQDLLYLKLTTEERDHLEEKIQQGFSFDSILEDIKESKDVNNEKKRRIHLLSRRDLYRIMYRSKKNSKSNQRKNATKESTQQSVNQKTDKSQKSPKPEEKGLLAENVQPKESICQNIALYPSHSSLISLQEPSSNSQSSVSFLSQQIGCKDLNIPQTSTEEVASQIVILSPNVNCSSIPEIILLSASNEVPTQPEIFPQYKLELHPETHSSETQAPAIPGDVLSEHLTRGIKSTLYLQLKEKLHKILEYLPHSEHLTPRQFDSVNAKLGSILDIFSVANEKARTRKNNLRKADVKRKQALLNVRSGDGRNENSAVGKQGQQHYESPLIYAIYN